MISRVLFLDLGLSGLLYGVLIAGFIESDYKSNILMLSIVQYPSFSLLIQFNLLVPSYYNIYLSCKNPYHFPPYDSVLV